MSSSKANSTFQPPRQPLKPPHHDKNKDKDKEEPEVVVKHENTSSEEPLEAYKLEYVHKAPEAAAPARSWGSVLWKYGVLLGALIGAGYIMAEANENPSWWYQSSIKAPYVITPSGRKLAYNEYGNALGKDVVLVFHDYLAGRTELEGLGLLETLKQKEFANTRVIVLDRPGYGQSDKQRHRRLNDWHEDVMRVVNALEIAHFSIIGIGAGGLYAMSCAEHIPPAHPGRLVNVALLGTESPRIDVFGTPIPTTVKDQAREVTCQRLLAHQSIAGNLALRLANIVLYSSNTPDFVFEMMYNSETKMIKARPEAYRAMVLGSREAWSQGFHSIVDELAVTKDRSAAASIGYSHIHLAKGAHVAMWHGDKDLLVPLQMAQYLAKIIPNAELHVCRGQGHLSSIINNWEQALSFVTTPPPAQLQEIKDKLQAHANASL